MTDTPTPTPEQSAAEAYVAAKQQANGDTEVHSPRPSDPPSPPPDDPKAEILNRHKPVPLSEFVRQDVTRRKWAIEGVWPEGCSGVIAGPPKGGKSTIVNELAISLASGTPFLEHFKVRQAAAKVTLIQAENSAERLRRDTDEILAARGLGKMEDVHLTVVGEDGEPEDEIVGQRFRPIWGDPPMPGPPSLDILSNPRINLMAERDREWLVAYAETRDYIILDPAYLLAVIDPNNTGQMIELLTFLSRIRDEADCALIFTHQMTDKSTGGQAATRLIGSTFIHGWYESALFTKRTEGNLFTIRTDNLREIGDELTIKITGMGVGHWFYAESAQNTTDSAGRESPGAAAKATRIEQMQAILQERPDATDEELAVELDVGDRTVRRYRDEIDTAESTADVIPLKQPEDPA